MPSANSKIYFNCFGNISQEFIFTSHSITKNGLLLVSSSHIAKHWKLLLTFPNIVYLPVTATKQVLLCLCKKTCFRSCRLYISILHNKDTYYPVTFSRIQTVISLSLSHISKGKVFSDDLNRNIVLSVKIMFTKALRISIWTVPLSFVCTSHLIVLQSSFTVSLFLHITHI